MTLPLLLEGPFESDYSLAVVNRRLAKAFLKLGVPLRLYQRDNTRPQYPGEGFLRANPDLAPLFLDRLPESPAQVHSRYIYPPYTDTFAGALRVVHCYGWEESNFPSRYGDDFNRDLDLITVMSSYVRQVLQKSGVRVPIHVAGLGADHILEQPPQPVAELNTSGFVFLHVSSCFPRKAPEILIEAFCREFTSRDDVRLVIKTFENPHNRIREILREADATWPAHAPIDVIWKSLGLAEMRWLYERASCLVSASRGEGFGLPVTEAMLVDCPVIATIHGGQADTCDPDNCWPVEFRIEQARTHLTEGASEWAEPAVDSLRTQMRAVYRSTAAGRREKTNAAHAHIARQFTWAAAAGRHWQACSEVLEGRSRARAALPSGSRLRIGFVSSWNTRCGIAEYTRYLAGSLPSSCEPVVFASRAEPARPDESFVVRCWEPDGGVDGAGAEPLLRAILASRVQAVSVQFNFGFFAPSRLNHLMDTLRRHGLVTAITMHATRHENLVRLAPALAAADYCFCHRQEEIDRLRESGLGRTLVLQRQGIAAPPDRAAARRRYRRAAGSFQVACFGFFLPPKGIHVLIQAMALARAVNPLLCLNLVDALYPISASSRYAAYCLGLLPDKGLAGCTTVTTDFLEDAEVLDQLAAADLVVLPYLSSSESSSAAVRVPLASRTPVACSDLPLFDEFSACLHRFPAGDSIALANTILRLAAHPGELHRFEAEQARLIEELAWPRIAARFAELILSRLPEGPRLPADAPQTRTGVISSA